MIFEVTTRHNIDTLLINHPLPHLRKRQIWVLPWNSPITKTEREKVKLEGTLHKVYTIHSVFLVFSGEL